jgi:hypothetical protein
MPKYILIFLIAIFCALGAKGAKADFEPMGAFQSANLLSGAFDAAWITGFYATTSLPAGTSIEFEFSKDAVTWHDKDGRMGYWSEMASSSQYFDLRPLNWATSSLATTSLNFYYRARLSTDTATITPVIYEVSAEYSTTYDYTPPDYGPEIIGIVQSTDLLSGVSGEEWITGFYATSSLPANTTVGFQFSSDGITWHDADGRQYYWSSMSSSNEYFDLRSLDWSLEGLGASSLSFYYRARLTGTSTGANPIIYEASVEYSESYDYTSPDLGYEPMGAFRSQDLLGGIADAAVITGFYATTSLPADTGVKFSFSYDNSNWYDGNGTLGAWSSAVDGSNYIDLRGLTWASSTLAVSPLPFYYRAQLSASSTSGSAPIIYEASAAYSDSYSELLVTSGEASNIVKTSATLNGSIGAIGLYDVSQHGFDIGTSTGQYYDQIELGPKSSAGSFVYSLSGLEMETDYYFRAYATQSNNEAVYGDELSFTTLGILPPKFYMQGGFEIKGGVEFR